MKVVIDVESMEELRRILEMVGKQSDEEYARRYDPTRHCPCRPENGGSGVCGCIMSGPKVTCSSSRSTYGINW